MCLEVVSLVAIFLGHAVLWEDSDADSGVDMTVRFTFISADGFIQSDL